MPTYALTVGGVAKSIQAGTLRISETVNGRNVMSFDVTSFDGSYRAAMGAAVIYTEDSDRIFGGMIDVPGESGFKRYGGSAIENHIAAVDHNAYADRKHINGIIQAGTLKAALQIIEPYLTAYGVTLDPAQVTGPSLPVLTLQMVVISKCLNDLSTLTGYVWEIDYNKVLRMFLPGSQAAPFNVVPASDPSVVIGDIAVESVRNEYANRIIVLAGTGIREVTESFTGDGSETEFTLLVGVAGPLSVTINGNLVTVGTHGVDTAYEWTFRSSDNALVQLAEAPPGTSTTPLTGGDTLTAVYPGQHPFVAQADDAGEQASQQLWEKAISEPDVFDLDQAQALADAYLLRYVTTFKKVRYTTFESGIRPGQTQTITVPDRNLSGTFLITDVETTDAVNRFMRRVTAVGGTTLPGSWQELYRQWGSRSGGGPPTAVGTGSTGSGTSSVLSSPYPLGHTRNTGLAPDPAAWLPVPNHGLFLARSSFGARVRAQAWAPRNGSVSVTVRLYDVTASTVAAVGASVTGTTPQDVTPFLVALTAGHVYRLEVLSGANGEEVRAVGDLEGA